MKDTLRSKEKREKGSLHYLIKAGMKMKLLLGKARGSVDVDRDFCDFEMKIPNWIPWKHEKKWENMKEEGGSERDWLMERERGDCEKNMKRRLKVSLSIKYSTGQTRELSLYFYISYIIISSFFVLLIYLFATPLFSIGKQE